MKKFKKLLAFILVAVITVSVFAIGIPTAAAAVNVLHKETVLVDTYLDYFCTREEAYEFNLKNKSYMQFDFSTQAPNITVEILYMTDYGAEGSNIVRTTNITNYKKTLLMNPGKYKVAITNFGDEDAYVTYSVANISNYATSIKLNRSKKTLAVGETFKLKATPAKKGEIIKSISYKSSNKKVATVDKNGKIKAEGLGVCTVTAKLDNGRAKKCKITVKSEDMYIFAGYKKSVPKINGKTKVTWKSANKNYVRISGQKAKAIKSFKVVKLTKKYKGVTYKVNVYTIDIAKTERTMKSTLKSTLKDPRSLQIHGSYIYDGLIGDKTVLTFDYGAKNSFGGYVRDVYNGWYEYNKKKKKFVFHAAGKLYGQ